MLVSTIFDRNVIFFSSEILLGYKLYFKMPLYSFSYYFDLHAFLLALLLQHFLSKLHNFSHFWEWYSKMQEKTILQATFSWTVDKKLHIFLISIMLDDEAFSPKKNDSNKKDWFKIWPKNCWMWWQLYSTFVLNSIE